MSDSIEIKVPDIGGFNDVAVIDVLVSDGQEIEKDTPLITLETEKAAMDVPAPQAGKVAQVKLKQGDKVSQGSVILTLEAAVAAAGTGTAAATSDSSEPRAALTDQAKPDRAAAHPAEPPVRIEAPAPPRDAAPPKQSEAADFSQAYASPSVRKFARELGADLNQVKGSARKGRITHEDVKAYVKQLLESSREAPSDSRAPRGGAFPQVQRVDFAAFGAVQIKPLTRIQKISGARLHASWVNLPHVTQYENADITDLEIVRNALKTKSTLEGVKLTPLAFFIKASFLALKEFPRFNSSLDPGGENLVLKQYYNLGFAADTPLGLLVPVIRKVDELSLFDIARSLSELSAKARAGKLSLDDMSGGTFTVSSLGGIGGTAFTPIINAPEVAILGISRAEQRPVLQNGGFVPRLIVPLSLSYDHRVIDGAEAARFIVFLSETLADVKALM